jgi:hypothetical protein
MDLTPVRLHETAICPVCGQTMKVGSRAFRLSQASYIPGSYNSVAELASGVVRLTLYLHPGCADKEGLR